MSYLNPDILVAFLYQSNLIEGIHTNLNSYYFDKKRGIHESNSCDAAQFVLQNKYLDLAGICKTHRLQMRELLPERYLGMIRDCRVTVGGDECPPPRAIKPLLQKFIKLWDAARLSPLELHFEFELIHPFVDGNGRTGRLLYLMDLIRRGEFVRPILDEFGGGDFYTSRQQYYRAIRLYKLEFAGFA